MWRIGRLLAGFAIALSLLLTPTAVASPVTAQTSSAEVAVVVGQQPPGGTAPEDETDAERNQRVAMGVAGVVLIGLVLLSRKARKKSLLFFEKKK